MVNRQYVFFQLGGNQIRSNDYGNVFQAVLDLVVMVRESNALAKIFFIAVLPRPVENEQAKNLVMKTNRWLSNAVDRVNQLFSRIKYLQV